MQSFHYMTNIKRESNIYRETVFSGNFGALLLLHLQLLPSVKCFTFLFSTMAIFSVDLLGDVLADLLGNRLTLLPRHLSLNVSAVLHLRYEIGQCEIGGCEIGGFNCFLKSDNLTSFWRGTCLHSLDSTCRATWVRSV